MLLFVLHEPVLRPLSRTCLDKPKHAPTHPIMFQRARSPRSSFLFPFSSFSFRFLSIPPYNTLPVRQTVTKAGGETQSERQWSQRVDSPRLGRKRVLRYCTCQSHYDRLLPFRSYGNLPWRMGRIRVAVSQEVTTCFFSATSSPMPSACGPRHNRGTTTVGVTGDSTPSRLRVILCEPPEPGSRGK